MSTSDRPPFTDQFLPDLYEEQPDDVFVTIGDVSEPPRQINASAITYYAKIGMKPKRIAPLVGVHFNTIWSNSKLRAAYENGAAFHEVYLRTTVMHGARLSPTVALEALNRVAGQPEDDMNAGADPTEVKKVSNVEVNFTVTSATPATDDESKKRAEEIARIRALLDARVKEAQEER